MGEANDRVNSSFQKILFILRVFDKGLPKGKMRTEYLVPYTEACNRF